MNDLVEIVGAVAMREFEQCRGRTIYSIAHARVMRESHHDPGPLGSCTCGAAGTN